MTTRSYYRASLLFPVAVWPALWLWAGLRGWLPEAQEAVWQFLLFAGAPYVVMVLSILRWTHERSDQVLKTTVRLSPMVLAGCLVLNHFLAAYSGHPTIDRRGDLGLSLLWIAVGALALGYICVAVVEFIYAVLVEARAIDRGERRPGA